VSDCFQLCPCDTRGLVYPAQRPARLRLLPVVSVTVEDRPSRDIPAQVDGGGLERMRETARAMVALVGVACHKMDSLCFCCVAFALPVNYCTCVRAVSAVCTSILANGSGDVADQAGVAI